KPTDKKRHPLRRRGLFRICRPRSAPVPGRSNVRITERLGSFPHLPNVVACCARGRAHSDRYSGLVSGLGLRSAFSAMKPQRLPSPPYNPGVRDLVEGKRAWSHPLPKDEIERGFLGWHENG